MNLVAIWDGESGTIEIGDEEDPTYLFTILLKPEENIVEIIPGVGRMVIARSAMWQDRLTIEISPRSEN
jgi:hypothetical protein